MLQIVEGRRINVSTDNVQQAAPFNTLMNFLSQVSDNQFSGKILVSRVPYKTKIQYVCLYVIELPKERM
jgi:hypothetical protein